MLNTKLNFEHFAVTTETGGIHGNQNNCGGEFTDLINNTLTKELVDNCKKFEDDKQYLSENIDYKTLRKTLWDKYNDFFDKKKNSAQCTRALFYHMFTNIDSVKKSNEKKKVEIENLRALINKQNKEINDLDKQIGDHKMYDEIKQSRIISSDKVRYSSVIEYYIYIVLIVVFLIIQICLLVF